MAIGGYTLSTDTLNPSMGAVNSAAGGAVRMPHFGGAGVPQSGVGYALGRLGGAIRRWADERDERNADDAALALQKELSDNALALYQKRGSDAGEYVAPDAMGAGGMGIGGGVALKWSQDAEKRMKEVSDGLSKGARERLRQRMAPWLEGRRQGLLQHQLREARAGEISRLDAAISQNADNEIADVAARAQTLDTTDKAAVAEFARQGLAQIGAIVGGDTADEYTRAAKNGLMSMEEAAAFRKKHLGNTARTLMNALIANGSDAVADAVADVLSPPAEEGEGNTPAAAAPQIGIGEDEVATWRRGAEVVRERRAAKAKKAVADAMKQARDKATHRAMEISRRAYPEDGQGQAAYFDVMASDYTALGEDETLDSQTRKHYFEMANTARRNAQNVRTTMSANAARAEAAAEKARFDSVSEAVRMKEAQITWLRAEGTDEANRRADALSADLFATVQGKLADGSIRPKDYSSYMERHRKGLDADTARAMTRFYRAVGMNLPMEGANVTPAEKRLAIKDGTLPLRYGGKEREADAAGFFRYADRLRNEIEQIPQGTGRDKAIAAVIDRISTDLLAGGEYDDLVQNAAAAVREGQNAAAASDAERRRRARPEPQQTRTMAERDEEDEEEGDEQ